MSICFTNAGETLFASLQAQGLTLVIDTMIFANVPGLDPARPADRAQAVPTANVVHSAQIPPEFRAFVNPNQIVYSVLLGSGVGDFTFNWQGLYCSEHQTLIAVVELPAIEKRANDAGTNTPGNNLTRNFMLQFSGAQALTGLTIEAEVWQLDFTVRLKGIDERERLSNRDIYGRAAFLDAGWLLVKNAGGYHFEPGTGYVEGIRAALHGQAPAVPVPLPCDVFLDVCQAPQGSDVVTLVAPRFVSQGAGLPDYMEGTPFRTPHYCVQIARVAADGSVEDMRPKEPKLLAPVWTALNSIEIPVATEAVAGIIKQATAAQALAGVDNTTAMSPADVAAAIAALPAPAVITGSARNLAMSATGLSALVSMTADELVVKDGTGNAKLLSGLALSASTAVMGAGGLDTGAIAGSTWYAVWAIAKTDGTAALLLSASATAPTLPAGYSYMARVGWTRTDATANKYPRAFRQHGRRVQHIVGTGTNVTTLPILASGVAGNVVTPVYVAVAVGEGVPPTAKVIYLGLFCNTAQACAMVAPNPNYGNYISTTSPPPITQYPANAAGEAVSVSSLMLESGSIYWASNAPVTTLFCSGWEDI